MNEEPAQSRGPSDPSQANPAPSAPEPVTPEPATIELATPAPAASEPAAAVPSAWAPPADGVPEADQPVSPPPGATPPGGGTPPGRTPPGGTPPGGMPPPWWGPGGPSFSRDQLVRPRQGRYVAGVCAALARATNTDPVLWRVLVAVLGVVSGVGVLLYLVGWLAIPAEGDTVSPIESLLGKGRSGMAPLSIIVLCGATVLSFSFIVQDGMRAAILAAAVIIGAVLLIKRTGPAAVPPPPGPTPFAPPPDPTPFAPPSGPTPFAPPPGPDPVAFGAGTSGEPGTVAYATTAPATTPPPQPPYGASAAAPGAPLTQPGFAPPPGGYRPPFAPHGPYAQSGHHGNTPHSPRPPKPPRPPRERSPLGRLTFFAVLVVIGVLVVLSMSGAHIAPSAYFAAALVTIAAGLIVGAWFGRARGLIALALLATIGLGIANGTERWGGHVGDTVYRPTSLGAVADRYDFTVGDATLDLRGVDFTEQQQDVTATMKFGQLRVLLPSTVDTTATVQLEHGRAVLFGQELDRQPVTDLGPDGAGGGNLRLDLQVETGNVEVIR